MQNYELGNWETRASFTFSRQHEVSPAEAVRKFLYRKDIYLVPDLPNR